MAAPVLSAPSALAVRAMRLSPGRDIIADLRNAVQCAGLRAAFVITCVGSCTAATLRLANATAEQPNEIITLQEKFEIVSLVGTLSPNGVHIHVSLADARGRVIGGHAISLTVFTTAEIVLGECADLQFTRPHDPQTGFDELSIAQRA